MQSTDKVFKELFNQTDSILIIDVHGKVLFYQDYNDQINMMRDEEAIGRSIFDLYPFFKREDFTVFKAMDKKQPILNEIQLFEVNGIPKKSLNLKLSRSFFRAWFTLEKPLETLSLAVESVLRAS